MTGISYGLSPNAFKTALDKAFYQRYNLPPGPMIADARNSGIFIQDSTDRAAVIMEVFKGVGLWEDTAEQEEYKGDTPRIGNQITFTVSKFTKKFPISEEALEDDQVSLVKNAIRQMGDKARITQNDIALGVYRLGGSTTLTADGVALLSASHTLLNGDTVDNTISATLSVATIEEGINLLLVQKDQAGDIVGHEARYVLVPPELFKEAVEYLESELLPNSTDNNLNWVSRKYGITLYQSPYMGAAKSGGSATRWYMMGENHSVCRWVRIPIETKLLSPDNEPNGDTIYRGRYREVLGAVSHEGLVGFET